MSQKTQSVHGGSRVSQAIVNPVPWTVQPPSKTAICHIEYNLNDQVKLHVVPVIITRRNEVSGVQTPVVSQKLRRNAILQYLSQNGLGDRVAFKLRAQNRVETQKEADEKTFPIDHIIFFRDDRHAIGEIVKKPKKDLGLTQNIPTIKASGGRTSQESIHCEVDLSKEKILSSKDIDSMEYWKNVQLLLRTFGLDPSTKTGDSAAMSLTSTGALLHETLRKPNETLKKTTDSYNWFRDSRTTVNGASQLKILFRTSLKLDPLHLKLHAEIDLVPGIKGGIALSKLILDAFGPAALDTSDGKFLQRAKAMLVGLNVVRSYDRVSGPAIQSVAGATGISHSLGSLAVSPPSKRAALTSMTKSQENGRGFQPSLRSKVPAKDYSESFPASFVVDLKRACDVPDFWKEDRRYSVTQYLLETYPQLNNLEWPSLPLANIGKDSWVPLEFLKTNGDNGTVHELPMAHMTALLQERRSNYDLEPNRQKLIDFLNKQMQDMRKRHKGMGQILPDVSRELAAIDHSSKDVKPAERILIKGTETTAAVRCGVVYIHPDGVRSPNFDIFAKSIAMLLDDHAALDHDQQILKIDPSYKTLIAAIPDVKPLLQIPDKRTREIQTFYNNEVDTIIAVVDERGRSKQEIRYIRAELHKFGNRKLGAVVVCVSRKELEARTDKSTGHPTHLPCGILQQLNAMHGNPNFVSKSLPELSSKNLMIVGAHISHAGPSAAASCPSVAALVSSVDEELMHYTSSARLQTTLKATPWRNNRKVSKLKHEAENMILQLEIMMVERIQAWTTKRGRTNAPHIVFYRHGNASCTKDIVEKETDAIRRACEQFTWEHGDATFDYILVHKNAHIFSPYHNTLHENPSTKASHEFNIANSSHETGYKYQYSVQHTTPNVLSGEQYKTLTRHLNSNFQQKNASLAIVLPVHYAKKLAKRMYDYFHFVTTNQYDKVSAVQRRLGFSNEDAAENDRQMAGMMEEYLLGFGDVEERRVPKPSRMNPWLPELDDKMFFL